MHVLIVDDKEENRYLLEALLKGKGFDVISAANGADAFETLKSGGIDLIISDILMPVMDGFQLCREVRMDESLRHLPFIIYTATYTGPKDEEFATTIGADRFIVKPCEPEVFIEAVNDVLASARHSDGVLPPAPLREEEVLKLYNERLVRKLEQKMLELESEVKMRRESEEKYKTILENIEDGYYEVDLAGNFTFFNKSMCRILGYSSAEMIGMNNRKYMDAENADRVFQTFNQVFMTGEPSRAVDWAIIRKDGSICFINNAVSLIRNAGGIPIGFRGIARDVTDRINAEIEKNLLTEQLQQAQKMEAIGNLAGGVAHDFNNLLSVILGYGELMLESLGKEHPHHTPIKQIYQAGLRARDLTRQLLAYSRKQVLEVKEVDVNNVVTGFEKMLKRLIGEDIQLNLALASEPLTVKADITQLEQVLMNLAVNARDAMPMGGMLTIETKSVELDESYTERKQDFLPGRYAMIAVHDTGCGMDKETTYRIFEPFFTTKGKESGTGLGLATSYGIIKQHGGNIGVYSEPNQGTTFRTYLPLCKEADALPKAVSSEPDNLCGSETILLVEDDEQVRNLTRAMLKKYGYCVLSADNGDAAFAALEEHTGFLNLLLTDVVMPGMNGKELFKQISARYPDAKVLYMSGYADNLIVHRGLLDYGVNFIQKPFSAKTLAAKVRKILDDI